ncbi:lariat debranching enzyme isoform X2 [Nicotiana sylvestris]|uniref:lariat debranching enzyme isoform X2 n=1 Tax=Nicotiana sylvestris TaxID=4096 RepID=UPI00388CDF0D
MRIAVEGCMHGDLDNVYATLLQLQEVENIKIDLLLCCGDFQAVRNEKDLESLNAPLKYRSMNSFWKYYSGEKVAPFPTIFIGGNHEASNYLWELYYGGWAAPQIYFLGFAGVIKFGNIRIGGLSGIYKSHDYNRGHYEKLPYNQRDIRSIYHVREYDVHKLLEVEEPIDIFLSHDWPVGITDCGNLKALLRQKPFFEQEIQEGTLGSRPAAELLAKLRPSYWFSAHLHCKFAALVQHEKDGPSTKFLALDKCLPGRKFLQVIEIESGPGPHELQFDEEWLAITRKYNAVLPLTIRRANYSDVHLDTEQCHQFVRNKLQTRGSKPFEFVQTAPCYNPSHPVANGVFHGHILNPGLFYTNNENKTLDLNVWKGYHACVAKLVPDEAMQDKIGQELGVYMQADGILGLASAIRGRTKLAPVEWWMQFGYEVPNLQQFAIRVQSLTCRSSGCERNWSVYEHIHTKKRNKLELKKLNDLVFVKYNRTLARRYKARNIIDPILLDNIDEANEWLTGAPENHEEEEVFEGEGLTFGHVAMASEVEENVYGFRGSTLRSKERVSTSTCTSRTLINEASDEEEDDDDQYNNSNMMTLQEFGDLVEE